MTKISPRTALLVMALSLDAACLTIQTAAAQQQPAPEVLEYKGTVAAAHEVEVAPRLDGLLLKINFTAGQLVKQGDLLFEFAPQDNELSIALAQARQKQADAQLRLAEVKLSKARTLRTRKDSELQLLEAEAERDLAAGRADEARANVQLAELALQQTKLYAPISGIISRPLVHEGTYITKETRDQSRLATIVQLDPIDVVGQAPAAMYFQRGEILTSLEQTADSDDLARVYRFDLARGSEMISPTIPI